VWVAVLSGALAPNSVAWYLLSVWLLPTSGLVYLICFFVYPISPFINHLAFHQRGGMAARGLILVMPVTHVHQLYCTKSPAISSRQALIETTAIPILSARAGKRLVEISNYSPALRCVRHAARHFLSGLRLSALVTGS